VALGGASLALAAGEAVCVLGANGAGKSTLIGIAAGVLPPDDGMVLLDGRPLDDEPTLRRRVGLVADVPLLYLDMTGRQNLRFFARLYGMARAAAAERIGLLLSRHGLAARADEPVAAYSAGMRRRLDLARAVLHEPQVLLMDEPATALDAEGRALLADLVAGRRAAGRCVLLTAHAADDAAALSADRTVRLEAGRLDGVQEAPAA
jgi:ABC-2 type transport system ATP-binding protein